MHFCGLLRGLARQTLPSLSTTRGILGVKIEFCMNLHISKYVHYSIPKRDPQNLEEEEEEERAWRAADLSLAGLAWQGPFCSSLSMGSVFVCAWFVCAP